MTGRELTQIKAEILKISTYGEDDFSHGMRAMRKVILERLNQISDSRAIWKGLGYEGKVNGKPVYTEWECLACGKEFYTDSVFNYCPHCGRTVVVEGEE